MMYKAYYLVTLGILFTLLISGCLPMNNTDGTLPQGLTLCSDIRPTYCTREFVPVCGYLPSTQSWKPYANKCEACRDVDVAGYIKGKCSTDS